MIVHESMNPFEHDVFGHSPQNDIGVVEVVVVVARALYAQLSVLETLSNEASIDP
jgi:hypothetical protein